MTTPPRAEKTGITTRRARSTANEDEVDADVIVIGAGAAGATLAARLSEHAHLNVLLVEAGDENSYDIGRSQGAFYLTWGGPKDWAYQTTTQPALQGRSINHPRGRAVGGSSVLNVGAWLRGRPEDYDAWEQAGASGWNGAEALRTFQIVEGSDRGTTDHLRGSSGPITMSDLETPTELSDVLLSAFVEAGLGPRGDTNSHNPFTVDRYQTIFINRVRHTIADAFLTDEVRRRPNLHILTGAHARRILFDGDAAVAVEARLGNGQTRTIHASQEIVLSAGAIGTPHLLLLSGVGPAADLEALDIPVQADLPGVGANLQDHLMVKIDTLAGPDSTGSIPTDLSPESLTQWLTDQTGTPAYWTSNGVGYAAVPGHALPDFEILLDYTLDTRAFPNEPDLTARSGTNLQVVLLQPASRGTIRLRSTDPEEHPTINPGYLQDEQDIRLLVDGLRIAQQIATTPALQPWAEQITPAPTDHDDILIEHIRSTATTIFHPIGTARMGAADDPMTVVTPDLRVKGIRRLRIADASVFPKLNRGHTMAPSVFVGIRAADLLTSTTSEPHPKTTE